MSDTTAEVSSVSSDGERKLFRIIYAIPVIGAFFKELLDPRSDATLYFLLNVALIWILVGFNWGIRGIFAIALCLVPVMFIVIIRITLGKVPVPEPSEEALPNKQSD